MEGIAEGLIIRPGDKLVIRCNSRVTRRQFEELVAEVKRNLPDNEILFLAGGVEQIAVVTP